MLVGLSGTGVAEAHTLSYRASMYERAKRWHHSGGVARRRGCRIAYATFLASSAAPVVAASAADWFFMSPKYFNIYCGAEVQNF